MTFDEFHQKHKPTLKIIASKFRETSLTGREDYEQTALIKLWDLYRVNPLHSPAYIYISVYHAVLNYFHSFKQNAAHTKELTYDEIPIYFYLPDLTEEESKLLNLLLEGYTQKEQRKIMGCQYGQLKDLKESLKDKINV